MTYRLKDFGSYTAGGRLHRVDAGAPRTIQFTRDASYVYDPRGHFAVEHAYVQYFVPEPRRPGPPVVLVHGGGMHGSTWETTPDGRPGWLHGLLRAGYEVHVVDAVERGRAGFLPGLFEGEPIVRSLEEAWNLFRMGPADGFAARRPFPGQQFPIHAFDTLGRYQVPRWLGTTPLQAAALNAVLARTGPALVICHSQGGEITFDAQNAAPERMAGIIAVEPSGFPAALEPLADVPLVLMYGDYLDTEPRWTKRRDDWRALVDNLTANGAPARVLDTAAEVAPGGSHMLMMDAHGDACLAAALEAYEALAAHGS